MVRLCSLFINSDNLDGSECNRNSIWLATSTGSLEEKYSLDKISCFYPSDANSLCQDIQSMINSVASANKAFTDGPKSSLFVQGSSTIPMNFTVTRFTRFRSSVEKQNGKKTENETGLLSKIEASDINNEIHNKLNIISVFQSSENLEFKNALKKINQ